MARLRANFVCGVAAVALLASAACEPSPAVTRSPLRKISGDAQFKELGSTLAPLRVGLTKPEAGVPVTFERLRGAGSPQRTVVKTDSQGHAGLVYRLGSRRGVEEIVAKAPGSAPVSFLLYASEVPLADAEGRVFVGPGSDDKGKGGHAGAAQGATVPVAGAAKVWLSYSDFQVVVDDAGRFRLPGLPTDLVDLWVEYQSDAGLCYGRYQRQLSGADTAAIPRLTCMPAAPAEGSVADTAARPVGGATVVVPFTRFVTTSTEAGAWRFAALPPIEVLQSPMWAVAPGYREAALAADTPGTVLYRTTTAAAGSVSGRVILHGSVSSEGVVLTLGSLRAQTGADGRFAFTGVPPGVYSLRAETTVGAYRPGGIPNILVRAGSAVELPVFYLIEAELPEDLGRSDDAGDDLSLATDTVIRDAALNVLTPNLLGYAPPGGQVEVAFRTNGVPAVHFGDTAGVRLEGPDAQYGYRFIVTLPGGLAVGTYLIVIEAVREGQDPVAVELELAVRPNLPPTAEGLAITPALSGEALVTAFVRAPSDPDGTPVELRWEWFRDGAPVNGNGTGVEAGRTRRGETWEVHVYLSDGENTVGPLAAATEIGNRPPEVAGAVISPAELDRTRAAVAAPLAGSDPEGDAVTYRFEWLVNGIPVYGVTTATLEPAYFKRDDRVACVVSAFDGFDYSPAVTTNEIYVVNAPPVVPALPQTQTQAYADEGLAVTYAGPSYDVDGDPLAYVVHWYKNGVLQPYPTGQTSVAATALTPGDRWSVVITAGDGYAAPVTTWRAWSVVAPPEQPPHIATLSTLAADLGAYVEITGTHLGQSGFVRLENAALPTVTAENSVWSDTRIVFRVPADAAVGTRNVRVYKRIDAGEMASNTVTTTVLPVVAGLTEDFSNGRLLSVQGAGFAAGVTLYVNGWAVTDPTVTPTALTFTSAIDSGTFPVWVNVAGVRSRPQALTFRPYLYGGNSEPGRVAQVRGYGLGRNQWLGGWVRVLIDDEAVAVVDVAQWHCDVLKRVSCGEIVSFSVPETLPSGGHELVLERTLADGTVVKSNVAGLGVRPVVTSVSKTIATMGETVSVFGQGFSNGATAPTIWVQDHPALVLAWADAWVTFQVPDIDQVSSNKVSVFAAGQWSELAGLHVLPRIDSYTPLQVKGQSEFTLAGAGLRGFRVCFADNCPTPTSESATQLVVPLETVETGFRKLTLQFAGYYAAVDTYDLYRPEVTVALPYVVLPTLLAASPAEVEGGATLTLTGKNFSRSVTDTYAMIGGWGMWINKPTFASVTTAFFDLSATLEPGDTTVKYEAFPLSSDALPLKILPRFDGVTPVGPYPGDTVTITGASLGTVQGAVSVEGAPVLIKSWSRTSATFDVPPATPAGTRTVELIVAGTTLRRTITVRPRLDSLTPSAVNAGTQVTATGLGLGGSLVYVDGQPVTAATTTTSVVFWWPASASVSGNHKVELRVQNIFRLYGTLWVKPAIIAIGPPHGVPGDQVAIVGSGFGDTVGTVRFGSVDVEADTWTDNQIVVTVPARPAAGSAAVTVTQAGYDSNAVTFAWSSPQITGLTPNPGAPGESVTITGAAFGHTPGTLRFGSTIVTAATWSNGQIVATIPQWMAPGSVTVSVTQSDVVSPGFAFTFARAFYVATRSPSLVTTGTELTLTGTFSPPAVTVEVGGVAGTILSNTGPTLRVLVPGAARGLQRITVRDGYGGSTTGASVTVRGSDVWWQSDVPMGRELHSAVWTGREMIVWGGRARSMFGQTAALRSGARYNPAAGTWLPTSLQGAPTARYSHSAVWTGTRMIVWGGTNAFPVNTGAAYDPVEDAWSPTPTAGAPATRSGHAAVFTGTEMIVWGGYGFFVPASDGSRFSTLTQTWQALPASPLTARDGMASAWTGSKFFVWGGYDGSTYQANGAVYTPGGSWASLPTSNAPSARRDAKAWMSGDKVIVWGGRNGGGTLLDGAHYTPSSNLWAAIAAAPASTVMYPLGGGLFACGLVMVQLFVFDYVEAFYTPGTGWSSVSTPGVSQLDPGCMTPAANSTAIQYTTGSTEVTRIEWGGTQSGPGLNQGQTTRALASALPFQHSVLGIPYGSVSTYVTSLAAATNLYAWNVGKLDPGSEALAAWGAIGDSTLVSTGSLIFIIANATGTFSGQIYDPATDTYTALPTSGAPPGRTLAAHVWCNNALYSYGGATSSGLAFPPGYKYDPAAGTWTTLAWFWVPSPGTRNLPGVSCAGTDLVIWGGRSDTAALATGSKLATASATWTAMATAGAPTARYQHVMAWTGSSVVVWGGYNGTSVLADGARYNPAANTWSAMSATGALAARRRALAMAVGDRVWIAGGDSASGLLSNAAVYDAAADTWVAAATPPDPLIDAVGTPSGTDFWFASGLSLGRYLR